MLAEDLCWMLSVLAGIDRLEGALRGVGIRCFGNGYYRATIVEEGAGGFEGAKSVFRVGYVHFAAGGYPGGQGCGDGGDQA